MWAPACVARAQHLRGGGRRTQDGGSDADAGRGRILDFRPARGGVGQLRRPGASAACRRVQPAAVSAGRRGVRSDSRLGRIPRLRSGHRQPRSLHDIGAPAVFPVPESRFPAAQAQLSATTEAEAQGARVPCTACQSDHTFYYHVRRRITNVLRRNYAPVALENTTGHVRAKKQQD